MARGASVRTGDLAKVARPGAAGAVLRHRLFRRLDDGQDRPIAWVSAPAGSGKTSLVSSYVEARGLPCLWYQVDPGDADLPSFFHFLGLAAGRGFPRRARSLPHLTPDYLFGVPQFCRTFFGQLFSILPCPSLVVFDDAHAVPAEAPLHAALLEGLTRQPEGVRLILVSRSEPPPAYARLRANRKIELLSREDLRFTLEEFEEVVRCETPHGLPEDTITRLYGWADGWAAGQQLVLEALRNGGIDLAELGDATPDEILDYFRGEVFERLDPETRDFLLKTAFFPAMTARMAGALTGHGQAEKILSYLHRQNIFTHRWTHAEPVYRYHPLFREFLLQRGRETLPPEPLADARRAAASLLRAAGQTEAAAELLAQSSDWPGLRSLIREEAGALLTQGRGQTVARWLEALPETCLEEDPWLLYWAGASRLGAVSGEARAYLERAFAAFRAGGSDPEGLLESWSGVVEAILQGADDFADADRWTANYYAVFAGPEDLPESRVGDRAAAAMYAALIVRKPTHPHLAKWEARALEPFGAPADAQVLAYATLGRCYRGDRAGAEEMLDRLRRASRGSSSVPLSRIRCRFVEAFFHNTFGSFAEAEEAVRDGLDVAAESGVHAMDLMLLSNGVRSALNTDDLPAVRGYLERMSFNPCASGRWGQAFQQQFSAALALREGHVIRASIAAQRVADMAGSAGICYTEAASRLLVAEVGLARGDHENGRAELARARRLAAENGYAQIELGCLFAEATHALDGGRVDEAAAPLREGMALGREKGVVPYLCRPPLLARLCALAFRHGIEPEYAGELVRRCRLVPEEARQDGHWPAPIRVYTLGRFELVKDGVPLRPSRKAQRRPLALLKAVVAFGGRKVAEARIADTLWSDATGDLARRALGTALYRLRKLLAAKEAIEVREECVTLNPRYCWVDVWAFEHLLGRAEESRRAGRSENAEQFAREAIALYRGPFLPEESDADWVVPPRERLRSKLLRAVQDLGSDLERRSAWDGAMELYRKALEVDPLSEELYRRVMICHAEMGRKAEALAAYGRCRRVLAKALGVEPSPETERARKSLQLE